MLHASQLAAQFASSSRLKAARSRISDNAGPSSGRFSELRTQSARPLQQGNDPTLEPDLPTTSALFLLPLLLHDSKHLWTPRLPLLTNHGVRQCVLPSQVHSRPTIRIRRQIRRFLQVAL